MGEVSLGQLIMAGTVVMVAVVGALMKFAAWKGATDERTSDTTKRLDIFMKEIRADIKTVLTRLGSSALAASSPLRLNELGKQISNTLNLSVWADKTAATVRERVHGKSAYEIQEFCFQYVRKEHKPDSEMDKAIKDCAFDNGMTVEGIQNVLAVELRDRLLGDQEPP